VQRYVAANPLNQFVTNPSDAWLGIVAGGYDMLQVLDALRVLELLVPLEGLVDLDAERARLDKEIKRVEGEQEKSETKLAKFSDKVPPAVIEQERVRLVDWNNQLAGLREQRAKL